MTSMTCLMPALVVVQRMFSLGRRPRSRRGTRRRRRSAGRRSRPGCRSTACTARSPARSRTPGGPRRRPARRTGRGGRWVGPLVAITSMRMSPKPVARWSRDARAPARGPGPAPAGSPASPRRSRDAERHVVADVATGDAGDRQRRTGPDGHRAPGSSRPPVNDSTWPASQEVPVEATFSSSARSSSVGARASSAKPGIVTVPSGRCNSPVRRPDGRGGRQQRGVLAGQVARQGLRGEPQVEHALLGELEQQPVLAIEPGVLPQRRVACQPVGVRLRRTSRGRAVQPLLPSKMIRLVTGGVARPAARPPPAWMRDMMTPLSSATPRAYSRPSWISAAYGGLIQPASSPAGSTSTS